MATKRKTQKQRRKGKKLHGKAQDPVQVATILAYAAKESIVAASKHFGVADRTLRRYKARVNSGEWPEVAELLSAMKREAIERCVDLLTVAHEATLRRIIDLAPNMTPEQAVRSVEVTGQLSITKDALNEPDGTSSAGKNPS